MSHCIGEIFDKGLTRHLGFFEYNGTCDVACSSMQPNRHKITQNWRKPSNCGDCKCLNPQYVDVVLYSDYGYGYYWDSKICPICKVITGERVPFSYEDGGATSNGHPCPKLSELNLEFRMANPIRNRQGEWVYLNRENAVWGANVTSTVTAQLNTKAVKLDKCPKCKKLIKGTIFDNMCIDCYIEFSGVVEKYPPISFR